MDALRTRFENARNGQPMFMSWRQNVSPEFKATCPKMSFTTRLWCFLSCVALGLLLSFLGSVFLYLMKIVPFALFYSVGSILSFVAVSFLVGPSKQLKVMFAKNRWIATCIYLGAIGATIFVVFYFKDDKSKKLLQLILVIILIAIQYCAGIWYGLSFIPYGRKVVTKLLTITFCGKEGGDNSI